MHRCLKIQEIVRSIVQCTTLASEDDYGTEPGADEGVDEVTDEGTDEGTDEVTDEGTNEGADGGADGGMNEGADAPVPKKHSLVDVALVSRMFYEPAMDEIWAFQRGFDALFSCLPHQLLRRIPGKAWKGTVLARAPVGEEWRRFEHHAKRVRELVLYASSDRYEFDDHGFEAAALRSLEFVIEHFPKPLFPRLRSLDVRGDALRPQHILPFLHDQMCKIEFEGESPEDELITLLRAVAATTPNLIELGIQYRRGYKPMDDALSWELSRTICSLPALEDMSGFDHRLSIDAIAHLSRLPRFESLRLSVSALNVRIWDVQSFGEFKALTTLLLKLDTSTVPVEWISFVQALSRAPLQTVRIYAPTLDSPALELGPLFEALGQFPALESCSVSMNPANDDSTQWSGEFLDSAVLQGLFQVPGVTEFSLKNVPIRFSASLLQGIACAWPGLTHLTLFASHALPPADWVALADLAHLGRCVNLMCLNVEIAPVPADWTWTDLGDDVPGARAFMFEVQDARIDPAAAAQVAAFLNRYFPYTHMDHPERDDDGLDSDDEDEEGGDDIDEDAEVEDEHAGDEVIDMIKRFRTGGS
ncbi:hypothetical protein PsYK624_141090 [Phanerochaete sordida]|uniref:F-box domain-containing protein n=1 Tax=Phanerochaete sordida TaxID=48140 RepID=A0A9P3LL36_9APHY|nr:hypothetical protein PsYK624_141090 [Phanerochaete sordida]